MDMAKLFYLSFATSPTKRMLRDSDTIAQWENTLFLLTGIPQNRQKTFGFFEEHFGTQWVNLGVYWRYFAITKLKNAKIEIRFPLLLKGPFRLIYNDFSSFQMGKNRCSPCVFYLFSQRTWNF